jgi:hypothetical protein
MRRVSFDLIGLPPTANDVDAFIADDSPDAYRRLVDRLLASPHYGERWGRYWLDVARYADTKGYVFFPSTESPFAWSYRDYVVQSFNEDKPFDRFVREQLAADQLPGDRNSRSLAALGFITVGPYLKENRHDMIDDRIDVITRGVLGLTVSCARCHDHKFDPISMEDYYALYGVFLNSVDPSYLPACSEGVGEMPEDQEVRAAAEMLDRFRKTQHIQLMKSTVDHLEDYLRAAQLARQGPETAGFDILVDGDDLNPKMIQLWQQYLDEAEQKRSAAFVPWHGLAALTTDDFATEAKRLLSTWSTQKNDSPNANQAVITALVAAGPKSFDDVIRCYADLLRAIHTQSQSQAHGTVDSGSSPLSNVSGSDWSQLQEVLAGVDSPLITPIQSFTDLYLFPDRASQAKLKEHYRALEAALAKTPSNRPRAMVLQDAATIIEPRIFQRGNPAQPGKFVPRRFLQLASQTTAKTPKPFVRGSGRLELANSLISDASHLTARVIANRLWQNHFGVGLVSTPSNFGLTGERPSHPLLLDYLAGQLIANDWSLKDLHREIVLSATYGQQSRSRPAAERVDPENRFYWRMNRRRLDLESMRDAMLAVSGQLDGSLGGPPVTDMFATQSVRRSIYARIDRNDVPGIFRMFDFPDPNVSSPNRNRTTVSGQTLFLMNHPKALDGARHLAARTAAGPVDDRGFVERLYELALARLPRQDERRLAIAFLENVSEHETVLPVALTPRERLAHVVLLSNAMQFVD